MVFTYFFYENSSEPDVSIMGDVLPTDSNEDVVLKCLFNVLWYRLHVRGITHADLMDSGTSGLPAKKRASLFITMNSRYIGISQSVLQNIIFPNARTDSEFELMLYSAGAPYFTRTMTLPKRSAVMTSIFRVWIAKPTNIRTRTSKSWFGRRLQLTLSFPLWQAMEDDAIRSLATHLITSSDTIDKGPLSKYLEPTSVMIASMPGQDRQAIVDVIKQPYTENHVHSIVNERFKVMRTMPVAHGDAFTKIRGFRDLATPISNDDLSTVMKYMVIYGGWDWTYTELFSSQVQNYSLIQPFGLAATVNLRCTVEYLGTSGIQVYKDLIRKHFNNNRDRRRNNNKPLFMQAKFMQEQLGSELALCPHALKDEEFSSMDRDTASTLLAEMCYNWIYVHGAFPDMHLNPNQQRTLQIASAYLREMQQDNVAAIGVIMPLTLRFAMASIRRAIGWPDEENSYLFPLDGHGLIITGQENTVELEAKLGSDVY